MTSISPRAYHTNASVNSSIAVTFDKALSPSTVNDQSFLVFSKLSGRLKGAVSLQNDQTVAIFTPKAPLSPGDRIQVVITPDLKGKNGDYLPYGYGWQFDVETLQGVIDFTPIQMKLNGTLSAVSSGDFNGDGVADFVVAGDNGSSSYLQIFYMQNNFLVEGDIINLPYFTRPILVGDLNNDGRPDLIAIHRNDAKVSTLLLSESSKMSLKDTFDAGVEGAQPRFGAIIDLNNDGNLDLLVIKRTRATNDEKTILVYLNNGTGKLGKSGKESDWFWSNSWAEFLLGGDFNLDGSADVMAGIEGNNWGGIAYFKNPGNGLSFRDDPDLVINGFVDPEGATSADFTGNHLPDLIHTDVTPDQIVPYYMSSIVAGMPQLTKQMPISVSKAKIPIWIDYSDFDADGQLDVVVNGTNAQVQLLRNKGGGIFKEAISFSLPSAVKMNATGDFNGDGAADIVVVGESGDLSVLINSANGNRPPQAPALLSPANEEYLKFRNLNLAWEVPADAEDNLLHFIVRIKHESLPNEIFTYNSITNPDLFEPVPPVGQNVNQVSLKTTLPYEGRYSWVVQAYDGFAYGEFSPPSYFTIDFTPPADVTLNFPDGLFDGRWFMPQTMPSAQVLLGYTEQHPERAELDAGQLGGVLTNTQLPPGVKQQTTFALDIGSAAEGQFPLVGTVYDSAGYSDSITSYIGIDRNPPSGTVASSVADTVTQQIPLNWDGGTDGNGSGLAGLFSVQVKRDDGPWTLWLDRVATADTFFVGENRHLYSFEAAAYDNVGLFEGFANQAEVSVFVDASLGDKVPPGRPKNLTANGSSPSPWGTGSSYSLSWEPPEDVSGLERSYYKIGSPPLSNSDVTGIGPAFPPFTVITETEGGINLYLWLEDKRGNKDFNNNSFVKLRRDMTPPLISNIQAINSQPPFVDPTDRLWFKGSDTHELLTTLTYTEQHAAMATLQSGGLNGDITLISIPSGEGVQATFDIILDGAKEGDFDMTATISDSSDNRTETTIGVGIDGTSPTGSVASATDTSATESFKVTWTAGEDQYSGLSGNYDVYVSIDKGPWQKWLSDFSGNEREYLGQHGRSYRFESLAKDNVGNIEKFNGITEATVIVDTTADDIIPPAPPVYLTANGQAGASQWQKSTSFVISWENPADESGIVKSYYKIGDSPVSWDDFTGTAGPNPPLVINVPRDGAQPFYLWLEDRQGNVDFGNHAMVLLRSDATPPIISLIQPTNPDPVYSTGNGQFWYNSNQVTAFRTRVRYTEQYPLRVLLDTNGLLGVMTNLNTPAGENVETEFHLDVSTAQDALYRFIATVEDSATNSKTATAFVGLDGVAPVNCVATSPDTSADKTFTVAWSDGSDAGSGLSGSYDVYVQVDNGEWQPWLSNISANSAEYTGSQGHRYAFEAITRDNVGNTEPRRSIAETATVVDITADDSTAPAKPLQLKAGGSEGESPWQTSARFVVNWKNPNDESGVSKSLWKLGSPPTSNFDTTRSGGPKGPLTFELIKEGQQPLYLWLVDKRGNVDYRNNASVLLRYDKTSPEIKSVQFLNPDYDTNWFDQSKIQSVNLRLNYSEWNLDSLIVRCRALDYKLISVNPQSGIDITRLVPIPVSSRPDTSGIVEVKLVDLAGNVTTSSDSIHLDSSPPVNAVAHSPDISFSQRFLVSWSPGHDDGVGLSGLYDVYVRSGNAEWALWKSRFKGREAAYTGENGKKYQFEVLAYDFLQNVELQSQKAESITLIDTTASDSIPPLAPRNIAVSGRNPSPWQRSPDFMIEWENPSDQSGIARSYYKLGGQPASPADTTGSGLGLSPLKVRVTKPEGQWCHIWLMDGRGNADINNYSSIYLRWDDRPPAIDSLKLVGNAFNNRWINPNLINKAAMLVYYDEKFPETLSVSPQTLFERPVNTILENPARIEFQIPVPIDSTVLWEVSLQDSAGQSSTDSLLLSLDASPPVNTTAVSPDTAVPGEITLSWGGGGDGSGGSGLSDIYDIKRRVNGGEWSLWKAQLHATSGVFIGEDGFLYEFEAAAWDNVGNREKFTGNAEAMTFVSQSFSDSDPPQPPIALAVDSLPASGWTNKEMIRVLWENPDDVSGISRCYYKTGSPPSFNSDTTGSLPGQPPALIRLSEQGRYYLYFWLRDGRGNMDFHNYDSLLVKFDATPPHIQNSYVRNADYLQRWISPLFKDTAYVRINYHEAHPDAMHLLTGSLAGDLVRMKPPAGENQFVEFSLDLKSLTDGSYPMMVQMSDSAGNASSDSLQLRVDGTPPDSAYANSAEVSQSPEITVSWAEGGLGTDFDGSGLSGEYDVRIQINSGPWFDLIKKEKRSSLGYVGVHGFRYGFEVAAWDNVGNRESFKNVAETTTRIDTAYIDKSPPTAPLAITAAGSNPSPWQSNSLFSVRWENPVDQSGISRAYYKLDKPPVSNADTSGSIALNRGTPEVNLYATRENGQIVYLWLADGKGNTDYHNFTAVILRYDKTDPVIKKIRPLNAGYSDNWYNQKQSKHVPLRIYYQERNTKQILWQRESGDILLNIENFASDSLDTRVAVETFGDGSFYFSFSLVDSANNRSRADSVLLNFDSTPPKISHFQSDTVAGEGSSMKVSAIITDQNQIDYAGLLYWRGGQRSKPVMEMTRKDDSTFVAQIPADFISSRGLEYAIISSDGLSTARLPAPGSFPSSFYVRVRVQGQDNSGLKSASAFVVGKNSEAYRMVSVPLDLDDKSAAAVLSDDLGKYDRSRWRLLEWSPESGLFNEYPDVSPFSAGKVFWLITTIPDVVMDTGPGLTVDTSTPAVFLLKKGWNDIGNPFNFPIDWSDILTTSAADTQKVIGPYAYSGSWQIPLQVSVAEPWSGYSFYTEESDVSLVIPALAGKTALGKKLAAPRFQDVRWSIGLSVENRYAQDRFNFIGVADKTSNEWDYGYDFPEPPGVGSYVSLYFPHEEWSLEATNFTSDFRPGSDGDIWKFNITANVSKEPFDLKVENLQCLPSSVKLHLVDLEANVSVDLRQDSTYSFWFLKDRSVRHFKLIAGTADFISEYQKELLKPESFCLLQNFPNPFNSSTVIQYELKKAAPINLAIYNLLGQKVKTIHNGPESPGVHQFQWNALDDNGREVGTGIYVLRFQSPSYKTTKKMIYMR